MVCSEVLKATTQKLHAEAEAVVNRRLKGIRSSNDYTNILTSFFGFFAPVEDLAGKFINENILPDIGIRRKSSSIIKSLPEGTSAIAATASFLPEVNSVPQAFGAMYVLEGSTLGGRIIRRMLQANETVQLSSEDLAFFNVYGDQTFEMWNAFKTVMDGLLITDNTINAATETASDTFRKLKTWMQNTN